jgi:hypothetical protein
MFTDQYCTSLLLLVSKAGPECNPVHSSLSFLHRGYNIGIRLVDEFLAKARMGKCSSFRETAEVIAKQAFQMFINVQASVTNWSSEGKECSLVREI